MAQRGDTLNLTILGVPLLSGKKVVDSKGNVTVPLLGDVKVTEVPLSDLARQVEAMLVERNVVKKADVTIAVYEYAPIFVDGDVARPGEYKYRPEMAVRSAIAQAGGIDPSGGGIRRLTAPQVVDARSEYNAAAIELAKQTARTARLKAELAGADKFDVSSVHSSVGVEDAVLKDIVATEAKQMEAAHDALVHKREHLTKQVEGAKAQIADLEPAEKEMKSSLEQVKQQLAHTKEMVDQGLVTVQRVEEASRTVVQAQTQAYEMSARLAQIRKEAVDRARELDTFNDEYRARTLEALSNAIADQGKARGRMTAAQERMAGRGNNDGEDNTEGGPEIAVRRVVNGAMTRISANLDTILLSGDNINVRIPVAATNSAASR